MKLLLSLLLLVCFQALAGSSHGRSLRIEVTVRGESVVLRELDRRPGRPHAESATSLATLQAIYFSLECFVNAECEELKTRDELKLSMIEPDNLVTVLAEEGHKLLGPFADLIRPVDEVSFHVDWGQLKLPLDLLHVRGAPLFLTKRVAYAVGSPRGTKLRTPPRSWVGLLVSDKTADPDRAVFALEQTFPGSRTFDIEQFGLTALKEVPPVDFVAISGHGHVDEYGDGYIAIGSGESLRPNALAPLRPQLVYFDSCNLGISAEHLRALQRTGTAYAIAPILSNEAGDSSTATIEVFFAELLKDTDPSTAMFRARQHLHARYASDDIRTLLWRSFPFRVYRLN